MEISVRIGSLRLEMEQGKIYITAGQFHLGATAFPFQIYEIIFFFFLLKDLLLSSPFPGFRSLSDPLSLFLFHLN
jgi:hypothetical protein